MGLDPCWTQRWRHGGGRRVDGLSGRTVSVTIPLTSRKQKGIQVHLVSVCAPTSHPERDELRREGFEESARVFMCGPRRGIRVMGGDFNAELGTQQPGEESVVGVYSFGSRS
eukprot:3729856-Amphidinium_carterae.1